MVPECGLIREGLRKGPDSTTPVDCSTCKYSGQTADEVRDLMIGWIYDNYRNVKGWTRMAMQHMNIEFTKWLEDMQKTTMQGDDIALYILSHMFNKHVFIHNSMYGWSTLPYQMEDSYQDIVNKCDLELVFLKCRAFHEVKKIRGPTGARQSVNCSKTDCKATRKTLSIDKDVIPGSDLNPNVIPGYVQQKSSRSTKQTLPKR